MTFSQFAQQQALNDLSNLKSAVEGMPPGFSVGFELTIASDKKTVIIGSGICNIGGRQVAIRKPVFIEEVLFDNGRVLDAIYNLYIDVTGKYHIVGTDPVSLDERYGRYHPEHGWLHLGSFHLESDETYSEIITSNPVHFSDIIVPDGAIKSAMIEAGAITAEKIAAGAITGDILDINTILSSQFTLIDGGSPDDVPSGEEYNGGTDLSAVAVRVFNDNTGQYTDVPLNNVSIESPLFMREGIIGLMQSINYVEGAEGWSIQPDGDVEFNNGIFRGTVYATDGEFTGSLNAVGGTFKGLLVGASGEFTGNFNTANIITEIITPVEYTASADRVYVEGSGSNPSGYFQVETLFRTLYCTDGLLLSKFYKLSEFLYDPDALYFSLSYTTSASPGPMSTFMVVKTYNIHFYDSSYNQLYIKRATHSYTYVPLGAVSSVQDACGTYPAPDVSGMDFDQNITLKYEIGKNILKFAEIPDAVDVDSTNPGEVYHDSNGFLKIVLP